MERNEVYDFYKAILIFGVVWGHAITHFGGEQVPCNITWFLRLYDMPFFMLISGFFLQFSIKKYSMKRLLLDKVTTILVPTIVWASVLSLRIDLTSSYYFLYAIFFSSLAIILVENLFRRDNLKWLKWVCYILIILSLNMIDIKPYNLCYLFPYFLLGYKNDTWYKYKKFWFVLFVVGVCFWDKTYSIWNSDTNILHGYRVLLLNIYRLVLGCAAVATMRMVFDMAYMYFKTHCPSTTSRLSVTIGRETLGLYICHAFILKFLKMVIGLIEGRWGYNPLLCNERLLVYVIAPVFSAITLFLGYKVIELCKRSQYLKYLWGFKIKRANP